MSTRQPIQPLGKIKPVSGSRRPNFRLYAGVVFLLHAAVFAGLLLQQGCGRRQQEETAANQGDVDKLLQSLESAPPAAPATSPPAPMVATSPPPAAPSAPPASAVLPAGPPSGSELAPTNPPTSPAPPAPAAPSAPPASTAAGASEYEVQPGDYPIKIAKKFGVSLDDLYEANPGLNPRRLMPGQKLVIPPPRAKAPEAAPEAAYPGVLHKVQRGETLISIARKYGVTVREIREANNLRTDRILAGQTLKIPVHKTGSGENP
ncbi:MAG: LysM peptidoglycan-binding domain-containing protein [Verrucomicrobia bacterium]|nr:LysM peptidoglycan-binding domain-containing protein [Verrucomicrobiota bacterium]